MVQTGIRWGAAVWIASFAAEAIASLAGLKTEANIVLNFLSSLTVSNALAWSVAGGGVLYGEAQRRLKGRTVERLQSRIEELETMIDPQRSSSSLTKRGETNPKDKQ